MILLFKYLSFSFLNKRIEKYGFTYSFKSFICQLFLFVLLVFVAGKIYLLKFEYLIVLMIGGICVFPIILLSQFKYMYNNQRFENMVNYIEKMIIFFKQDPKILKCLENIRDFVDSRSQELIDKAIDVLHNDLSDERYIRALKIINDEYHSSRLISLHRFIRTVEEKSSIDYRESLNDLDYDLKQWVNRIYQYQSELKVKKTQFMISLIASILLLAIFSIMWVEVNELTHIIDHLLYQLSATIFLMSSLFLFAYVQSSINGQWLIEDYNENDHIKEFKMFEQYLSFSYKNELKKQWVKMIIFLFIFFYSLYIRHFVVMGICIVIILYLFYEPIYSYKKMKKKISSLLKVEFPLWLRDVALNLNNFIVVGAIVHSYEYAHPILQHYILLLLKDIEMNPTSIKPYTSFLEEYHLDITSFMLSLYSLQEVKHDYLQGEISDLIKRNQAMLVQSEKMRNAHALIGVLVLSFVPILTTMVKILIDMFIMLLGIFSYMGGT